jgi:hypothetical protein
LAKRAYYHHHHHHHHYPAILPQIENPLVLIRKRSGFARSQVKVKGKGEMATWIATVIPGTELPPVEEPEPDLRPFIPRAIAEFPEASGNHPKERRTSYQSLERGKGVVLTKEDLELLLTTARTRRKSITGRNIQPT